MEIERIDLSEKSFSSLMEAGRDYIGCESKILSSIDSVNLLPFNNPSDLQ